MITLSKTPVSSRSDGAAPAPARGACGPLERGLSQLAGAPWGTAAKGGFVPAEPPTYPALGTNGIHAGQFIIPGTGSKTDDGCGAWSSSWACSHDPSHYIRHIEKHCDNPSCPVCYGHYIGKAAGRVAERVRGYIETANSGQTGLDGFGLAAWHKDNTRYLNHFVLSPRPSQITPDMPYDKIKQAGRRMAARVGITGGVQIFHPFRIKEACRNAFKRRNHGLMRLGEEERDRKYWEMVRGDVLGLGAWDDYVEWSPHFHYIGFGRLPDRKTAEQKEAVGEILGGWILKWVRHVETERSFDGQDIVDPIAALASYLLSHAGYQPGRKIPSWCGVLGPNDLRKCKDKPIKEEYRVVCPKCGAPVHKGEFRWGAWEDCRDSEGKSIPYVLRATIQRYEIKPKLGADEQRWV